MNIVRSICCWGTDYCKCEFLCLTRNQNIKLTYIILIMLTLACTALAVRFQH